jgi:hypothetical protein
LRFGINIDLTRSFGGRRDSVGLVGDGAGSRFGAGLSVVKSDGAGAVDEVQACHVMFVRIGEGTSSATSMEELEGRTEGCLGL